MADSILDFSFNMQGIDRRALLLEAANRIDALRGFLGDEKSGLSETPEAALLRSLTEDKAEFGDAPGIFPVVNDYFISQNLEVPYNFKQWSQTYNFYWLDVPLNLFPRSNWAFNKLEVAIEFNSHITNDGSRPKSYQILPDRKFRTLAKLHGHFEVHLNGNFEFSAKIADLKGAIGIAEAQLNAGIDSKVAAGAGLAIPPYVYSLKVAKIEHTPPGIVEVRWRLDGAEFFQENMPRLTVIFQIPKTTRELKIAAAMQAYRHFNFASAGLRDGIKELSPSMRRFFKGGMPVLATTSWSLTPML
jgi:hypothetical protein